MKKLLIRVDATPEIGMGHVIRVKALLEELKEDVFPIICGDGSGLKKIFKDYPIYPLSELSKIDFDIALLDCLSPYNFFEDSPKPKIIIDDFGGHFKADCIINGTVLPEYHSYTDLHPDTLCLVGAKYALLRKEFRASAYSPEHIYDIVIVSGSGKGASKWVDLLLQNFLYFKKHYSIALIVGSQFTFPDDFKKKIDDISFFQSLSGTELAHILKCSRLALITGGMILYECVSLGIPNLSFPSEQNILPEIDWFEKKGVTENLANIDDLPDYIEKIFSKPQLLEERAKKGQSIVDGYGAERVASFIQRKFLQSAT